MTIKENCTQEQFEGIHQSLDQTRRKAKWVKIDREALAALLVDHGRLQQINKGN